MYSLFLFVFELRPMGLDVLGYQSHLLQRCHPACGHEGSSHLSPVLALRFLIAMMMQGQHSYNSSTNGSILHFTCHVLITLSRYGSQNKNLDFHKS